MKNKVKCIAVRFSEKDWAIINRVAKSHDTWAGTWVREIAINELVRLGKRKEDEWSGVRPLGRNGND